MLAVGTATEAPELKISLLVLCTTLSLAHTLRAVPHSWQAPGHLRCPLTLTLRLFVLTTRATFNTFYKSNLSFVFVAALYCTAKVEFLLLVQKGQHPIFLTCLLYSAGSSVCGAQSPMLYQHQAG